MAAWVRATLVGNRETSAMLPLYSGKFRFSHCIRKEAVVMTYVPSRIENQSGDAKAHTDRCQ